jgi:ferredoxin
VSAWTVTIDRELCMGSGLCVLYASGTFEHDGETKAVVLDRPTDDLDAVRNAVSACPTAAITINEGA